VNNFCRPVIEVLWHWATLGRHGSIAIAAICFNWICLNYLLTCSGLYIREETIADVAVSAWAPQ